MRKFKYLYISGPMTGLPRLNFPAFAKATKALRKAGYKVISPAEMDGKPDKNAVWSDCMRRDVSVIMKKCYAMALLPGWFWSSGAKVEIFISWLVGIEIHYVDYYVKRKI
ncbi:MAG: DUF4406 domain-containing protein [Candidatus Peribacteraceae bacterium]|nr:DUF4406 domain-containing protein [Candidatus Peribacteraceae bacterium]